MKRSRHPKKEIEEAIRHAEDHGWRIEVGGSHAWGRMYCPYNDQECRCGEYDQHLEHAAQRLESC